MANQSTSSRVVIAVALIAAFSTLGAAFIQSRGGVSSAENSKPDNDRPEGLSSAPPVFVSTPSSVLITGVKIGSAADNSYVTEHRTIFGSNEDISVTVHYKADETVRDFPKRVTTRIFSGFGQVTLEKTKDVSMSGDGFVTFLFGHTEPWLIGKNFLTIEVAGTKVYSQELDVGSED